MGVKRRPVKFERSPCLLISINIKKRKLKNFKVFYLIALMALLLGLGIFFLGYGSQSGSLFCAFFLFLSIGFRGSSKTRGYSFSVLIFGAVTFSLFYPQFLISVGTFKLSALIVPLLQILMFGMGTSMSFGDFKGVIKMPKGVFIGLVCQFTIMPFIGFGLASVSGLSPEIAAGIILIGAAPSGLASNVMAYLANANLALSVTLTAVATLLSPLVTPLLMDLLAGQFIAIDPLAMTWSIVKMVIIPIIAGLVFNHFFHGKVNWLDKAMPILSMASIAVIISIITASGRDSLLNVGLLLVTLAIAHNLSGYFLGYWGCRLFKMSEKDCRTIALEVGMQNGGLASGIALEMGKLSTVGLAPAIFGPWMNISGSSLATWWRDKPIIEKNIKLGKKTF